MTIDFVSVVFSSFKSKNKWIISVCSKYNPRLSKFTLFSIAKHGCFETPTKFCKHYCVDRPYLSRSRTNSDRTILLVPFLSRHAFCHVRRFSSRLFSRPAVFCLWSSVFFCSCSTENIRVFLLFERISFRVSGFDGRRLWGLWIIIFFGRPYLSRLSINKKHSMFKNKSLFMFPNLHEFINFFEILKKKKKTNF